MEQRIYHGEIKPEDLAEVLVAEFNRGEFIAQQVGTGDNFVVQIATRRDQRAGGRSAISVSIQRVEDGVSVLLGQKEWAGVAASLGVTAFNALLNPWSILGRLDDIAQDLESLQLEDKTWKCIDQLVRSVGASYEVSERLRRLICAHCDTPNQVGDKHCVACGAPLGKSQPVACLNCGFIVAPGLGLCPNCGKPLAAN